MKIIALGSAIAVALISTIAVSSPAMAQHGTSSEQTGHYEWRDAPAIGPRAIPHRVQVWIGALQMASNCACSMMKAGKAEAAACMEMPKSGQPHPNG